MASYVAPQYDEEKYRKGIDSSFYNKAIENYKAQQEQNRATQLGEAQKQQQSALKQAYLTRAQNQLKLKQNLAQQGIRGGASETANIKLANQYGADRAAANANYINSVNSINQSVDRNIFDYQSDMESRAEEYRQNQANARWQADREDTLNEYNSAVEYWNNYYLDYYSGTKKKNLNKELKKAEKLLANATTAADQIRYEQMIRGIRNRLGVIRNK